jgi:HSP20 family protein
LIAGRFGAGPDAASGTRGDDVSRQGGGETVTTLVRQPLLPEFDVMERRLRRMFEGPLAPAADVYETPEEFVIELEVPGYEEEELGLAVSDHMLTISGAHEETTEKLEKTFRLHERIGGSFERSFVLPPEIEGEHVTATFEKGLLKVHAPKAEAARPHKITISKP